MKTILIEKGESRTSFGERTFVIDGDVIKQEPEKVAYRRIKSFEHVDASLTLEMSLVPESPLMIPKTTRAFRGDPGVDHFFASFACEQQLGEFETFVTGGLYTTCGFTIECVRSILFIRDWIYSLQGPITSLWKKSNQKLLLSRMLLDFGDWCASLEKMFREHRTDRAQALFEKTHGNEFASLKNAVLATRKAEGSSDVV